jgi:hypothetical protein
MKIGFVVLLLASSFALSGCLLEPWRPGYNHDSGAFGGLCKGGPGPDTGARCSGH